MVGNGPRTFDRACIVVISDQEILSFGGYDNPHTLKEVWKYNVHTSQWTRMPDLIYKRFGASCQLYKDGPLNTNHYVLVAGGIDNGID